MLTVAGSSIAEIADLPGYSSSLSAQIRAVLWTPAVANRRLSGLNTTPSTPLGYPAKLMPTAASSDTRCPVLAGSRQPATVWAEHHTEHSAVMGNREELLRTGCLPYPGCGVSTGGG